MTIFFTAYDTTACLGTRVDKIEQSIKEAVINGWLESTLDFHAIKQVSTNPDLELVPAFAHPLIVDNKTVIDVRQFGGWDKAQMKFTVRSMTEYKLLEHRAALTDVWKDGSQALLRDFSGMPMAVYSIWLSESISRRFGLDPREQLFLQILAGIYYYTLFIDNNKIEEHDKLAISSSVVKNLKVAATDVFTVLDKIEKLSDIKSFCAEAYNVTESIRLKDLNAGVLFSIIGGTWYGVNARELVAVATEHPPTWLAILLASFEERTYKNSYITNITERRMFSDSAKTYSRAILNITKSLNDSDDDAKVVTSN